MTSVELDALRLQLIDHEGLRLRVYTDTVGKATIGVGRNLVDKGITQPEAMMLLAHDIDECVGDLETFGWFAALDPVRARALCDLRFNLGAAKLRRFVKMLDGFEQQNYGEAAAQLVDSLWATQVGRGRVDRLVTMIRTGQDA